MPWDVYNSTLVEGQEYIGKTICYLQIFVDGVAKCSLLTLLFFIMQFTDSCYYFVEQIGTIIDHN